MAYQRDAEAVLALWREIERALEKAAPGSAEFETAEERTRAAQERFVREPVDSPRLVPKARTVQRRAEDLHELAVDAREEASEGPPTSG